MECDRGKPSTGVGDLTYDRSMAYTEKELREILAQEVEKDRRHFSQIPRGLRSGNEEEYAPWEQFITAAMAALRRVNSTPRKSEPEK